LRLFYLNHVCEHCKPGALEFCAGIPFLAEKTFRKTALFCVPCLRENILFFKNLLTSEAADVNILGKTNL